MCYQAHNMSKIIDMDVRKCGSSVGRRFIVTISILQLLVLSVRADTGVLAWAQRYPGLGSGKAVAVDLQGNAIATGTTRYDGNYSRFTSIKYSNAGVPLWTNYYQSETEGDALVQTVSVEQGGSVIVAGYSVGSGSNPNVEFAVIKYSSAGLPIWTNRYLYPGDSSQYDCGAVVDDKGNVILAGYSSGSIDSRGYLTIKYSGTGTPLWTNRYAGAGDDFCRAVAVDLNGDIIVTGESYVSQSSYDCLTIKYSAAGQSLWTNRYNASGNYENSGYAVATDHDRNVIVSGYSDSGFSEDFVTLKYSSDGVALWTNRYDGPEHRSDRALSVAVDEQGGAVAAGYSVSYDDGTYYDYLAIKYSSSGIPLWTNRYNGRLDGYDAAAAVAVDRMGSFFLSGHSYNGTALDYVTIKYSGTGVPLWTNHWPGPGNADEQPLGRSSLAVGMDGSAYLTGNSGGSFVTIKYLSGAALEPPRLTDATNPTLTWTAVPNQACRLEFNRDPSSPNWSVLTNVIAVGSSISVNDVWLAAEPRKFYRVQSQ